MWKPLRLTTRSQANPCLLVRCDSGPTSYTLHLTDLTYLWTESLDRKQIIRRALELNTSIDPSEDGSQMRLFLGHIRRSFEGSSGTSVSLAGNDSSNKLSLMVSVTLPSPLAPLEWPVLLSPAPQDMLTSLLVIPCLTHIHSLRDQVDSLLQHIREKDNVIRKLTDRMQSDGTDLSRLFPSVASHRSGPRLSPREAASKSVKGMADFDELDWRERFSANGDAPRSIHELAKSVFTFDHGDAQVLVQPIDSQSGWWKQMQSDDLHPAPTRDEVSPHQVGPSQAPFHDHKNSSFGDFQVSSYWFSCRHRCAS